MLRVRELSLSESHYVSRLCKTTRDAIARTRAMIVLHSMQGFSPPKIARMVYWSPAWVRRVVRDFNRMRTAALYPHRAAAARPPSPSRSARSWSTSPSLVPGTTGCLSRRGPSSG